MKRNLILTNLLLTGLAVWLGYQFRNQWMLYQRQHNVAALNPKTGAIASIEKPTAQTGEVPNYVATVDNHLFNADRNNFIPQDQPAQAKELPPKPILVGTLQLDEDEFALMISDVQKDKPSYTRIKVGESLDGYTLVRILDQKVMMRADGKDIEVRLNEPSKLVARELTPPSTASNPSSNAGRVTTVGSVSTGNPAGANAAPPLAKGVIPEGTIVNGRRKKWVPSPFGPMETWEDVK
ncbi:MAG: hypothetical protein DMG06_03455 [Acidobacteria bacterium]|nr:MAG: hypothetical protein DMG06_03455 [Acidobacteriota bacterium]